MNLAQRVRAARRVYVIGNGGSYANAVHIVNDLVSAGVRAHTIDPATLTALANDYSYESAFARWLCVVAERGDMLIALSGSGTSKNIVSACATAKEMLGMDVHLETRHLDGLDMQQSEEVQIAFGHALLRELRAMKGAA